MKRRGFLTKLGLGIVAAPSVAKAAIEDANFVSDYSPEGIKAAKDLDAWSASTKYSAGDIVYLDGHFFISKQQTINISNVGDTTSWDAI